MRGKTLLTAACMLALVFTGCAGSRAFQRGEQYARQGEWDLAVKEYREANKQDPGDIAYRSALIRAEDTAANHHYKRARNFLKERKLDQAITELQQAIYLNPTNAAIQGALKSVLDMKQGEEHYRAALTFQELNRLGDALNELNRAVELDPDNAKYYDARDKLLKQKAETEPDEALTLASDKPITLNFKNTNIKEVFELLAKLSGINILFDEEVKAQPVTIFVKDVSFQHALNLLLSTNKLFMKKISADTIIIVPKTKAKTDQYQDLMVRTFYLNNAKSKDVVNLLRTMLDTKKVYVNEALNSLTVRDTPEKMKLIEKTIAANDLKEAEVILDVEILELSRSDALKYGWNFVGSRGGSGIEVDATIQGTTTTGTTTTTAATSGAGIALSDLQHLSNKNIFITLPKIVFNLIKQDSDAQTLSNPRIRVLNNKQAKFHIGDRIPIQTSTVQATTVAQVTSTFEYKDVGIKLNIEPTVHLNNTVTMKMGLEVSTLGDALDFGGGQKQYKFGTRNTDTIVNLRDGETVIIGGLIKDEERKSRVKVPVLGEIPVLGKLFSSTSDDTIKTDILMSITPNIVRALELPDKDVQSFWSGTEENYDVKQVFVAGPGKTSKPAEKTLSKTEVLDTMAKREKQAVPSEQAPPTPGPEPSKQAAVPSAAVVQLKPVSAQVAVGQETRFELTAENVQGLFGAILTITYDPKVIDFKTAGEGQLMNRDGQQTSFLFSNNIKGGTVDLYLTRIGDVGGVNGNGTLCTLVFQGKAGGTSDLSLKSAKLTNYGRETLKSELKGGKVTVK